MIGLGERREAALQLLNESFAQGLIDIAALERRTASALQATTVAEIERLVTDRIRGSAVFGNVEVSTR
jgi:hypothetical protein